MPGAGSRAASVAAPLELTNLGTVVSAARSEDEDSSCSDKSPTYTGHRHQSSISARTGTPSYASARRTRLSAHGRGSATRVR